MTNGLQQYYVVKAEDSDGKSSAFSAEVAATPSTGPFASSLVAVRPATSMVDVGEQIVVTGTFADGDGVGDLDLLEVRVAEVAASPPRCIVRYDAGTDTLKLLDESISTFVSAGAPSTGSVVSKAVLRNKLYVCMSSDCSQSPSMSDL